MMSDTRISGWLLRVFFFGAKKKYQHKARLLPTEQMDAQLSNQICCGGSKRWYSNQSYCHLVYSHTEITINSTLGLLLLGRWGLGSVGSISIIVAVVAVVVAVVVVTLIIVAEATSTAA